LTAPIALSDPARILVDAAPLSLPGPPFGKEPAHTWCYFYEKAELARQRLDWKGIVELAAHTTQQGLAPEDAFEWLPFIEGYARTGNARAAEELTRQAWDQEPRLHRGLCILWGRLQEDDPADAQDAAARIFGQFSCGQ
jgi:hypothetical protein